MRFNYVVTPGQEGLPLRSILSKELNISSTLIKKIKLYGTLEVNGEHATVKYIVKTGDTVFACYDDDAETLKQIPGIPVFYEDEYFAVVEKPSGMVTHPVHGHLDDSLLTALSSSDRPLHPVMRLDRETSGLMIIAKSGHIHKLFTEQQINKKYIAAVYGIYECSSGTIDLPIKRREGSVMIRDVCESDVIGAHPSVTHYRQISADGTLNISLVEFTLETGRCHQIRVHSTYMGHPLVGDGLYGPCSVDNPTDRFPDAKMIDERCGRLALHAYHLDFKHPVTGTSMTFESPLPGQIKGLSPQFTDHLAGKII